MRTRHVSAAVLALAASAAVTAAPVTYEFNAVFNGGSSTTIPPWYDFGLPYNAPFSGSFTIETDTPAAYADANIALYDNPVTALTFNAGPTGSFSLGAPYAPNGNRSSSANMLDEFSTGGAPFDQLNLSFSLSAAPGDDPALHRGLSFDAYTGEWIPGNLFTGLPTLEGAFTRAQEADFLSHLSLTYYVTSGATPEDYRYASVSGQVTDLHVVTASVPEPATLSLLGAGLLGALAGRRRRSSARA